jgi:CRISPR system Cascade subunit CasA
MNLINDAWIPVSRADGAQEKIEPWRITENIADDRRRILAVASPRPDFDGALVQFLIGLLQTTCTPRDRSTWRSWREKPPSADQLKALFGPTEKAFNLYSEEGPLFMQERLGVRAEEHPVAYLLIGSPTDATLKQNTDHFQKRPIRKECLCTSCAAMALYTLQTFAPSGGGGGDGKFTGVRGGGPMTTLILGDSLWETVWLNVIAVKPFSVRPPDEKTFPWLNLDAFITGPRPVKTIHSVNMNPEHVFWGMPRRIQLQFSSDSAAATDHDRLCSLCGVGTELACKGFKDNTGGLTYQLETKEADADGKKKKIKRASWIAPRHPLSPYNQGAEIKDSPTAVHPQEGGIGYRHWLGLIENSKQGKIERLPATVIEQFRSLREDGRLWAFGYDMVNMKARCWYDSTMPLLAVPDSKEASDLFKAWVEQLVIAARQAADELRQRTKSALVGDADVRGDLSFVPAYFWGATEASFYIHVRQLRALAPAGHGEQPVLESWLAELLNKALATFDQYSQIGDFDALNPRRIALARNKLARALSGKKIRQTLGLPARKTQ